MVSNLHQNALSSDLDQIFDLGMVKSMIMRSSPWAFRKSGWKQIRCPNQDAWMPKLVRGPEDSHAVRVRL
jgi:hypothetical protein